MLFALGRLSVYMGTSTMYGSCRLPKRTESHTMRRGSPKRPRLHPLINILTPNPIFVRGGMQGSSCSRFHFALDNWKDCVWRAGELHGGSHQYSAVFHRGGYHGVRVCCVRLVGDSHYCGQFVTACCCAMLQSTMPPCKHDEVYYR